MLTKQLNKCAARLPEPQRSTFLDLQARAIALSQQASSLRQEAWAIYHELLPYVGKPKDRPDAR